MTSGQKLALLVAVVVSILAMLTAGYNFVAGRELTTWADSLQAWSVAEHADHGGPPDHMDPPPPPPPW